MGCGQSKINLYPRRNKSGHKANGAKKAGAAEKETDEEEGAGGTGGAEGSATDDDVTDDEDKTKHLLPLVSHAAVIEVSASQQDFFKMLDEKIEKGKDYDSTSESEIRAERDRRMKLVRDWQSKSQSSTQSQPSPPTPIRRRPPPRPDRDRPSPPPPRRCHSAQAHHNQEKSQVNGARDWQDSHPSPVRRPQSAGAGWKSNPKVAPFCQKVNKTGASDCDDAVKRVATSAACEDASDASQITYNPTFQTHSPAHAPHKSTPSQQQPYIAQIVNYPSVNPAPPNAYISPPETYQDQPPQIVDCKYASVPRQASVPPTATGAQSNIYYIHGNAAGAVPRQTSPDQLTQKQQTALHLQHYVAMKQAQQNMFSYLQRLPHGYSGPDFPPPLDVRPYDASDESYGIAYYAGYRGPPRPRSAPPSNSVRPAVNPIAGATVVPLVNQVSMFTHITPVLPPYGQFPPGQVPQTEVQYYQQAQLLHNLYRPGSAGSAGTLTRYSKPPSNPAGAAAVDLVPVNTVECQSINIVRQKAVGQIVSLGGQDLGVYQNSNDRAAVSPGSSSGGGGSDVSPGPEGGGGGVRGPAPPPPQRTHSDTANKKCDGVAATTVNDKCKKSNGGTVKSRTKILKNSKSFDSK